MLRSWDQPAQHTGQTLASSGERLGPQSDRHRHRLIDTQSDIEEGKPVLSGQGWESLPAHPSHVGVAEPAAHT
ncbi:hypothetical protein, partial [Streptomyces coffeae]|uniref:hypothetical protein n=1 Tax=Streptomyces coffeae TaxID=621382 RepID=UPI001C072373